VIWALQVNGVSAIPLLEQPVGQLPDQSDR
jgi:hypothetical protein